MCTYVQITKTSDFKDVTIGVPQGSILGPLLFLLSFNYLPRCLTKPNDNMFADDTMITRG